MYDHEEQQEGGEPPGSVSPAEAVAAVEAVMASVKATYREERLQKENTPTGVTLRFGQPSGATGGHGGPSKRRGVSVTRPNSPAAIRRNDPDRPMVAVNMRGQNRGVSPGGRRLDRGVVEAMHPDGALATVSAPRPIGTLDKLGGARLSSRRAAEGPVRARSRKVSFSGESAREREHRLREAGRIQEMPRDAEIAFGGTASPLSQPDQRLTLDPLSGGEGRTSSVGGGSEFGSSYQSGSPVLDQLRDGIRLGDLSTIYAGGAMGGGGGAMGGLTGESWAQATERRAAQMNGDESRFREMTAAAAGQPYSPQQQYAEPQPYESSEAQSDAAAALRAAQGQYEEGDGYRSMQRQIEAEMAANGGGVSPLAAVQAAQAAVREDERVAVAVRGSANGMNVVTGPLDFAERVLVRASSPPPSSVASGGSEGLGHLAEHANPRVQAAALRALARSGQSGFGQAIMDNRQALRNRAVPS